MRRVLAFARNLLIVLGIAFLLVSFTVNTSLAESTDIVAEPDNWGGFLLSMSGPITLSAIDEMGRPFALYVLALQDAVTALQESSVNHTRPFLSRENITLFSETIPIVIPGVYGILISPTGNETIAVLTTVGRVFPQWGFIVFGVFLIVIAISIEGIKRVSRAKTSFAT
jgi:hypothetical protein